MERQSCGLSAVTKFPDLPSLQNSLWYMDISREPVLKAKGIEATGKKSKRYSHLLGSYNDLKRRAVKGLNHLAATVVLFPSLALLFVALANAAERRVKITFPLPSPLRPLQSFRNSFPSSISPTFQLRMSAVSSSSGGLARPNTCIAPCGVAGVPSLRKSESLEDVACLLAGEGGIPPGSREA